MAYAATGPAPAATDTFHPELWHWLAVSGFVAVVLVLDLVVFHRHSRETTLREAAIGTLFWCALAMGFNAIIWRAWGAEPALLFLTGYLIEWSLSMDNVFVFAVIFAYFRVPKKYQYRVLFWGILGAVGMRLTFVLLGAELIRRFFWVNAFFGLFLIYTAFKLMKGSDHEVEPEKNLLYRAAKKVFPLASGDHGDRFFVRLNGKLAMTPLFLVLLVVESTDVLFAVDSVPAIFGITDNAFIVFTSNIFAILGLRALYFLLAGVMDMFRYLNYGLAAILGFVGLKMTAETLSHWEAVAAWLPKFFLDRHNAGRSLVSPVESLSIILSLLAVSIITSIIAKRHEDARAAPPLADAGEKPAEVAADEKP
jgi:tellurite resistance protein TerC